MAPTNDDFADAEVITGLSGTVSGSNVDATAETGEPMEQNSPNETLSVWWSWTCPTSADVQIEVDTDGSDFDTTLGIYQGGSVDALALIAANDDSGAGVTSRLLFTASPGETYLLRVAGYDETEFGSITLTWSAHEFVIPDPVTGSGQSGCVALVLDPTAGPDNEDGIPIAYVSLSLPVAGTYYFHTFGGSHDWQPLDNRWLPSDDVFQPWLLVDIQRTFPASPLDATVFTIDVPDPPPPQVLLRIEQGDDAPSDPRLCWSRIVLSDTPVALAPVWSDQSYGLRRSVLAVQNGRSDNGVFDWYGTHTGDTYTGVDGAGLDDTMEGVSPARVVAASLHTDGGMVSFYGDLDSAPWQVPTSGFAPPHSGTFSEYAAGVTVLTLAPDPDVIRAQVERLVEDGVFPDLETAWSSTFPLIDTLSDDDMAALGPIGALPGQAVPGDRTLTGQWRVQEESGISGDAWEDTVFTVRRVPAGAYTPAYYTSADTGIYGQPVPSEEVDADPLFPYPDIAWPGGYTPAGWELVTSFASGAGPFTGPTLGDVFAEGDDTDLDAWGLVTLILSNERIEAHAPHTSRKTWTDPTTGAELAGDTASGVAGIRFQYTHAFLPYAEDPGAGAPRWPLRMRQRSW